MPQFYESVIFEFLKNILMCLCVPVEVYMDHVCARVKEGQKRMPDPQELELWTVRTAMWELGTTPWSSATAVTALTVSRPCDWVM